MERTRENVQIVALRTLQVILGGALTIYGIVGAIQNGELAFVSIALGACIVIFGTIGFFAIQRHVHDIRDTRLYLLILYIDSWAVLYCMGAGIGLTFVATYDTYWYGEILIAPLALGVASFVCMLTIIPHIWRTLRLWWTRQLYGMQADDSTDLKKHASSLFVMRNNHAADDLEAGRSMASTERQANYEALICQAADEIRTINSSRPISLAVTTNATLYPNIMSAAGTVRSKPAPS